MATIFSIIFELVIFALALVVFIQCTKDVLMDKEVIEDIKDWFKDTKIGMWYTNKKNGVTILSEKQYQRMLKDGKIKPIQVEQE